MAVTDRQLLESIQYTVIEPADLGATWPSGLWTLAEILAYANQRQYRFMKDTGLIVTSASITANTGAGNLFDLPTTWISTYRAAWKQSGAYRTLHRSDTWEADNGIPTWEVTTGTPKLYLDSDTPTLKIQVAPAPDTNGTIEILYVALTTALTQTPAVNLTIPDEFAPYMKYGILADMLSKIGRGQDLERAAYCEERWAEGIALAQLLVGSRT